MTEVKASKDGTSYTIGRYIYDKLGRVARFIDGQVSGKSCTYGYDLTDRLCEAVFDDGTAYRYTYDANDCLVKEVQTTPDGVRTVTRGYDADSRETSVACGSAKIEKTFDKLGRLSSIRRNGGKHTTAYTYETASDGGQTGRIKTVKNGSGTWEYAYDAWGNVSKATENGSADSHTYTYDAQGQLTREYDPDKKLYLGYQYDAGGNLTEVRSYPAGAEGEPEGTGTVLKSFAYGSTWKDQLALVTMDGKTRNFTYDANGNLLSDGKYTYSWTKGSLLEEVTGDGLEAVYTYDASGIRTSKKVNGTTTEYLTAGGGIGMVIGAASSAITQYMFNGEINWKSVGVAAVGGFVSGAVAASPLGLTGQIGVGAAVGAVSYVADCKVNGSALKVDELAVSAAAGAVSGGIGGSGANQYKALSNTIKTASKTTARFTRLISTKGSASLAAKRIAEAKMWRDTVLKGTTWISSIKFAAGTGTSNVIAQLWTKAKNKVRSWFK